MLDCQERISLSAKRYKELHKNKLQFIAIDKHDKPEIEKIVSRHEGFNVIQKYGDPPSAPEIETALKAINSREQD